MRSPVVTAFAIAFGLVVLLGYFVPQDMPDLFFLTILRSEIIGAAVTLAGFATLVAILGLVGAHWRKLRAPRNPDRYSFFMLAGFLATFGYGLFAYVVRPSAVVDFLQVVNAVQIPVEASLMAVLAVTLTLASFRLFQRRKGILPLVFVLSILVFLLLNSGILAAQENIPFIGDILAMLQFLPVAGGRGILLGIALGSLMVGLRVLLGAERPYTG
jgi:hypothetical protein